MKTLYFYGGNMMKRITTKDAPAVLTFCLELKAQDAKMSFTDFDTLDKINGFIHDPVVFLYASFDGDVVTSMFRALRGVGNKTHSVYVACAVKREYRKQNLATDVTNYGLEDVKKLGVKIARTKIYSWNKASIATIKKCGFEESGRVFMHQFEPELNDYIDDLIFHKVL